MNKRWGSKDNKIEKVVSTLLIPDICGYFVKCKPKKMLGKDMPLLKVCIYILGMSPSRYTLFALISLEKGVESMKLTACNFLKFT